MIVPVWPGFFSSFLNLCLDSNSIDTLLQYGENLTKRHFHFQEHIKSVNLQRIDFVWKQSLLPHSCLLYWFYRQKTCCVSISWWSMAAYECNYTYRRSFHREDFHSVRSRGNYALHYTRHPKQQSVAQWTLINVPLINLNVNSMHVSMNKCV